MPRLVLYIGSFFSDDRCSKKTSASPKSATHDHWVLYRSLGMENYVVGSSAITRPGQSPYAFGEALREGFPWQTVAFAKTETSIAQTTLSEGPWTHHR